MLFRLYFEICIYGFGSDYFVRKKDRLVCACLINSLNQAACVCVCTCKLGLVQAWLLSLFNAASIHRILL